MNRAHKIAVLDRALELLGRKGEHWARDHYFAKPHPYYEGKVTKAEPKEATAWCLAGACGQAAFELGVVTSRLTKVCDDVVKDTSLGSYVLAKHDMAVTDFNDDPTTSFLRVRRVVKDYLEILKGEQS